MLKTSQLRTAYALCFFSKKGRKCEVQGHTMCVSNSFRTLNLPKIPTNYCCTLELPSFQLFSHSTFFLSRGDQCEMQSHTAMLQWLSPHAKDSMASSYLLDCGFFVMLIYPFAGNSAHPIWVRLQQPKEQHYPLVSVRPNKGMAANAWDL